MKEKPGIPPPHSEAHMHEVITRYRTMVYGIALARVRTRADADDVFQEVFLAYFRGAPAFSEEEHRKAWLIQTTLRCSKKLLFSPFARRKAPLQEADALPVFDTREDTDLWRALCALPDKYRLPVHLFYFEDMTTRQIAAALSLSEGSVRVRLTRGRALLREKLGAMGIHSL